MFRSMLAGVAIVSAACVMSTPVHAADAPAEQGQDVVAKAVKFLLSQQQPDGSWASTGRVPPAVTAMAVKVIAQDPATGPKTPSIKGAVESLLKTQKDDGGFYRDAIANYNTAITISGLAVLDDPALKPAIDKAVLYLKKAQWTDGIQGADGAVIDPQGILTGGWNYGAMGNRPQHFADLSNTSVMLDALKDSGLKPEDPAFQNALKFITKMQNRSESNPMPWAGNDGGFTYHLKANGEFLSAAGSDTIDGKAIPRSYGSMTYAGLKSMIYAGVSKDDPRVKAAWKWVSDNYTMDENPGMSAAGPEKAKAGLFYYYSVAAKALRAYGEPIVVDKSGVKHDWRADLIAHVAAAQKEDGSFVGDKQWMEDNSIIATTLATLAVQDALADLKSAAK